MLSSLYVTSNPSIPSWPILLLLTLLFVCPWLWMKLLNWCCFCHSGHKCHLEIYTVFENNFSAFLKKLFFLFLFQNHACTCTGNWIWREFYLHDFGYILEHSFITILITCHSLENDKKKTQARKVSQHLKENIQLNHKQTQNNLYQSKQISNYQYKFRQKMEYHIQLFSSQVLYAF